MFGKNENTSAEKLPVSAHRAFPVVVALWFAALFGLGSVLLPVVIFEKLTTGTGLASIFSAAAPPLGFTARLLIALFAAICGAMAGIFIARKVAAAQGSTGFEDNTEFEDNTDELGSPARKRPISAHEELGSEYLDEPIAEPPVTAQIVTNRRRSLTANGNSSPSPSELPDEGYLPDNNDISALGNEDDIPVDTAIESDETLDLQDFDYQDSFDHQDSGAMGTTLPESQDPVLAADEWKEPLAENIEIAERDAPDTPDAPELESEPEPTDSIPAQTFDKPTTTGQSEMTAELTLEEENVSMNEHFSAPDGNADNPPPSQPQTSETDLAADASESEIQTSIGIEPESASFEAPAHGEATLHGEEPAHASITSRPLSALGMTELLERFALALQNQKKSENQTQASMSAPSAPYNPFSENIADAADIKPPVFRRPNPEPVEDAPALHSEQIEDAPTSYPEPVEDALALHSEQIEETPAQHPEPVEDKRQAEPAAADKPTFAERVMSDVPSSLQPINFDDEDEDEYARSDDLDDLNLSLNVTQMRFDTPQEPPVADTLSPNEEDSSDTPAEDGHSPLVEMKAPLDNVGQKFVRVDTDIDEESESEPVVVFPGQEPAAEPAKPRSLIRRAEPTPSPNPQRAFDAPPGVPVQRSSDNNISDSEKSLREALEKLQKSEQSG